MDTRQKNFQKEDKKNIREVIVKTAIEMIDDILEKQFIDRKDIELIGIASPRFS